MESSRGHHNSIPIVVEAASNAVNVLMSRSCPIRVMDEDVGG